MRLSVGLVAAAVVGSALTGCTDLTPIQNDLKDLHAQVSRLSSEVASVKASADNAAQQSSQAQQAADHASSTAHQALTLAQSDQKSIDQTNERLDRMFRRHLSK